MSKLEWYTREIQETVRTIRHSLIFHPFNKTRLRALDLHLRDLWQIRREIQQDRRESI